MSGEESEPENTLKKLLKSISDQHEGADIILYSGDLDTNGADKLIDITKYPSYSTVFFALCTPGGDAHSAYRIAKRLQQQYDHFVLYIYGYCKSAGTLIAIGSSELVMGDYAELGPLDVQLQEKDEIWRRSSGLNIEESINSLKASTLLFFSHIVMELTAGAGISTRTAAEVATQLSTGFISPIVSQIDPLRFGESQRAIKIAIAYGERLINQQDKGNLESEEQLAKLVSGYPDHGFIIDYHEASEIFHLVRTHNVEEQNFGETFKNLLRYPKSEPTQVIKFYPTKDTTRQLEETKDENSHKLSVSASTKQGEEGSNGTDNTDMEKTGGPATIVQKPSIAS